MGLTSLSVEFNRSVKNEVLSYYGANYSNNYRLVEAGTDGVIQSSAACSYGVSSQDVTVPLNSASFAANSSTRVILGVNNGAPLTGGYYRLFVCSTIEDLAGNRLNSGQEEAISFHVNILNVLSGSSMPQQNAVLKSRPVQLQVAFNKDVWGDGSSGAANNPFNYLLVGAGADSVIQTNSCVTGANAQDTVYPVNAATYTNNGGAGPFVATLAINGGVPLPAGKYQLLVCRSIKGIDGRYLYDGNLDSPLSFSVFPLVVSTSGSTPQNAQVLRTSPTVQVAFNYLPKTDASSTAANNAGNYLLVGAGVDGEIQTASCAGGVDGQDVSIAVNSAIYSSFSYQQYKFSLGVNDATPLPDGKYRLYVCSTVETSDGYRLNDGAFDTVIDFSIVSLGVVMGGQTSPLNNAAYDIGPGALTVEFNSTTMSSYWSTSPGAAVNYLLVGAGADGVFQTTSCASGASGQDVSIPINKVDTVTSYSVYRLTVNGGAALPQGQYRLLVCSTIQEQGGARLNRGLYDTPITFSVSLPVVLQDGSTVPQEGSMLQSGAVGLRVAFNRDMKRDASISAANARRTTCWWHRGRMEVSRRIRV